MSLLPDPFHTGHAPHPGVQEPQLRDIPRAFLYPNCLTQLLAFLTLSASLSLRLLDSSEEALLGYTQVPVSPLLPPHALPGVSLLV